MCIFGIVWEVDDRPIPCATQRCRGANAYARARDLKPTSNVEDRGIRARIHFRQLFTVRKFLFDIWIFQKLDTFGVFEGLLKVIHHYYFRLDGGKDWQTDIDALLADRRFGTLG